jgi:branched-chain amino acid aminotransferase
MAFWEKINIDKKTITAALFLSGAILFTVAIYIAHNKTTSSHAQSSNKNDFQTLVASIKKLPFGAVMTEHMFVMEWTEDKKWHNARIQKYENFTLDPSLICLHYGPSIFEGMKAFRTNNNKTALLRPTLHLQRLNKSAKRMCMPMIDEPMVLGWLKQLVKQDTHWIPQEPGAALYIRPFMFSAENTLNLKVANKFMFCIILSPMFSLYQGGFHAMSMLVSDRYTRASVGGVGDVKTAGNYAASMLAQKEATKKGCKQVLWLDPVHRKYVEEVGSMNIFFVIDNQLVTPKLTGTILPGITRQSVLELSSDLKMRATERKISIDEVITMITNGRLTEIFGTGTAATIVPIGQINYKDHLYTINDNQPGKITKRVYGMLTDIFYQKQPIHKEWLSFVD